MTRSPSTATRSEGLLNLHGLALPDESVKDVVKLTEGWAAGVRLAALALQSGGDPARLHWLTAEYLAAEVLSDLTNRRVGLPGHGQLVRRDPAGLASGITGRADADLLLRQMSLQQHLPVQPVRGRLGYYRMHPLMRAVLAKELPRDRPAAGVDVRSRAADWSNTNGQLGTAVEHTGPAATPLGPPSFVVRSLAIGDLLLSTATGSQVASRLSGMPDLNSPDVHLVRAALYGGRGELESARASLGQCLTDTLTSKDRLISIAVLRTWLCAASGNVADTLLAARAAREHMLEQAGRVDAQLQLLQALVLSSEGVAHLRAGDLDAARRALRDASRAAGGGTSDRFAPVLPRDPRLSQGVPRRAFSWAGTCPIGRAACTRRSASPRAVFPLRCRWPTPGWRWSGRSSPRRNTLWAGQAGCRKSVTTPC